jgi:hypothetical protein
MLPRSLALLNRAVTKRPVAILGARAFSTGNGKQGFASMDPHKQKETASKGGQTSNAGHGKNPQASSTHAHPAEYATHSRHSEYIVNPNRSSVQRAKRVQEPEKIEFKKGDLVRFNQGPNMTLGIVQAVHTSPVKDELGRVHNASVEDPMAEIQNHYTKHIVFKHLPVLHWLATAEDIPPAFKEGALPTTQEKSATHSTIRETPESTLTERAQAARQAHQPTAAETRAAQAPAPSTTQSHLHSTAAQTYTQAKKGDTSTQVSAPTSPINIDFAPGDIVRYQVAKNVTAGVIQDIYFTQQHDEHGGFHNASRENPMARIENLWTKSITYRHLDVLELVQEVNDVVPGRYAASKYDYSTAHHKDAEFVETSERASEYTNSSIPHTNSARHL